MRKIYLIALSLLVSANFLHAQTFKLLKDINAQTNSNPTNSANNSTSYAVLNGKAYFAADDGVHGVELWSSDGTTAGTKLVKDINPGSGGSDISYIYAYKNKVYFFSTLPNSQFSQLCVSDGTSTGTVILKDSLGVTDFNPFTSALFTELNDTLYFTVAYEELWKTDGTKTGTNRVVNLYSPEYNYSYGIGNLTAYNNKLYFIAGYNFGQLWCTDGSAGGTHKFTSTSYDFSFVSQLSVCNNIMYIYSSLLWQTKGDLASTKTAINNFYYDVSYISAYKNTMLAFAISGFDASRGLYRVDSSAQYGMSLIKTLKSLQPVSIQNPYDSLFYFLAEDATDSYPGLWVSDGTTANTIKLLNDSAGFSNFFVSNKKLYFSHTGNNKGEELWVTDGSAGGTKMVRDINPGVYNSTPSNFTQFNESLLFTANTNNNGYELWKTDGTTGGTSMIKDINLTTTSYSLPGLWNNYYDTINNKIIFWAYDGIHGNELWTTDGSNNGTVLLKDILVGPGSSDGTLFLSSNSYESGRGNLGIKRFKNSDYFFASSTPNYYSLWKTQGSAGNTSFVSNISPSIKGFSPERFGVTNNYLFMVATIDTGSRLYSYSGIGDPMLLKKDFVPAVGGTNMLSVADNIYFFISTKTSGIELWKSDGTVTGTTVVKSIYATSLPYMIDFKDQLFFIGNSGGGLGVPSSPDYAAYTDYLWKSDGTASGTSVLKKLPVSESQMVISNNKLYFIAKDSITGEELWVTDGTTAGTHLVKDIAAGTGGSNIYNMIDFNGVLYFIANDGSGQALWKTDGTDAGTLIVKKTGNLYIPLINGNNKIYFIDDNKVWLSDGTKAGTIKMDTTGLEGLVNPSNLIYVNGKLYFTAYSYAYGQEIYTTTQSLLPVTLLSFKGHQQGNDGLLQWRTVNEQNNSYFNVQRSLNGVNFTTVGKVYAKNNLKENDYDYTDANITALGTGKVYYRLQQFDLDGKFTYSNTIQLDINAGGLLKVGPNPAGNFTNLYSAINIANAIITVADMNGHTLYTTQQNLQAGGKTTIPLTGYAKGMYTITVEAERVQKQEFKLVIGK